MIPAYTLLICALAELVTCQTGVDEPLATQCGDSIVCVNRYAAVMPYHYFRSWNSSGVTPFGFSSNDSSFEIVKSADFLVFDENRGLELLGPNASYEFMFNVPDYVHEAPVYAPVQNKLFLSELHPGVLHQLVVNLNQDPPVLEQYIPTPPVYAPNGGTFHDGLIIFGASGGNDSIGGGEQRPSIRTLDPAENTTVSLLNNYFGIYFNTIDDLAVHPVTGDIWFTDPDYSWFNALTDTAPQLPSASYRFNTTSGATFLIDDSTIQPNGIAFNPDGTKLYISDTGAVAGSISPDNVASGTPYNAAGRRSIYEFDMSSDYKHAHNKRPIYLSSFIADGLKVAQNGYIVTGAGMGVDILDEDGQLLVRIQANYTVQNFAWTGPNRDTLWMVGEGGISKVEFNLPGQILK